LRAHLYLGVRIGKLIVLGVDLQASNLDLLFSGLCARTSTHGHARVDPDTFASRRRILSKENESTCNVFRGRDPLQRRHLPKALPSPCREDLRSLGIDESWACSINPDFRALRLRQALHEVQGRGPSNRVRHAGPVRDQPCERVHNQKDAAVWIRLERLIGGAQQEDVRFRKNIPGVVPVTLF